MTKQKELLFIKSTYWLGAIADALWAVGLLIPGVFSFLTGEPNFNPDFNMLQVMRIGGVLMAGWTVLLIWGALKPIERRGVLLITAFPVIFGLIIVVFLGLLNGDRSNIWLLIKTLVLFTAMMISYFLACKIAMENENSK